MNKALIASLLVFAVLIAFSSVSIAQMSDKEWEKTVTLPSGEVILDMSGEWDWMVNFYGIFNGIVPVTDILKITQAGNAFTAVKQIGGTWSPKGTETTKGELNKDGFKVVYSRLGSNAMDGTFVWEECKWEISKDGNKINLDCGERAKITLTRR